MTTQTVAIINAVADVIAAVKKKHKGIPDVVVTLASAKGKHGHFAPSSWSSRLRPASLLPGARCFGWPADEQVQGGR